MASFVLFIKCIASNESRSYAQVTNEMTHAITHAVVRDLAMVTVIALPLTRELWAVCSQ